ncbi:hypothetical protein SAY87_019220 [Trapa incisa]|uniref:Uncharacterized protein n=1 Tax=Trapa incisa TaxID=236973 RepID=A0AAN7K448_9MYRT|nr:hypothetical protein SAY87_019220 [Trapa incisa]
MGETSKAINSFQDKAGEKAEHREAEGRSTKEDCEREKHSGIDRQPRLDDRVRETANERSDSAGTICQPTADVHEQVLMIVTRKIWLQREEKRREEKTAAAKVQAIICSEKVNSGSLRDLGHQKNGDQNGANPENIKNSTDAVATYLKTQDGLPYKNPIKHERNRTYAKPIKQESSISSHLINAPDGKRQNAKTFAEAIVNLREAHLYLLGVS